MQGNKLVIYYLVLVSKRIADILGCRHFFLDKIQRVHSTIFGFIGFGIIPPCSCCPFHFYHWKTPKQLNIFSQKIYYKIKHPKTQLTENKTTKKKPLPTNPKKRLLGSKNLTYAQQTNNKSLTAKNQKVDDLCNVVNWLFTTE